MFSVASLTDNQTMMVPLLVINLFIYLLILPAYLFQDYIKKYSSGPVELLEVPKLASL